MKKEYLHLRIQSDHKKELQKLAKQIGISLTSLILVAIDQYKKSI